MNGEFSGSVFGRAAEAPEEVVVGRAVAETKGLQPEDLGVLVYLLLLSTGDLASAKELAAGMRALGWKMSVDRFEVIAKRLMKAGHLNRESVYDAKTKRPQWRYWAYRNPANNPEYLRSGAGAQVTGEVGENPVSGRADAREVGENPVSPGHGRNREIPEFGESPSMPDGVHAGQSRNGEIPGSVVHPPHPPEEVDTSSPYPLTSSSSEVPSQGEEEVEFSSEEIQAAERFLQTMQQPWNAGRATARKCTPLLLRVMAEQGWPSIQALSDIDRRLLERDLTKNPEGISRFSQVLPKRIADLALYDAVARRARPQSAAPTGVDVLREERTPTKRSLTELLEQMNKPCP
ncbi:hypothetical protein [Streptomyces africanus]|uniref:hypothetical protein n=1 Tax=Streptomyces africanus TaxID=231024 RepID=UPI000A3AF745|nr:hypothetical protein [Streptomyces africanus]